MDTESGIAFGGFKRSWLDGEGGPEGLMSYLETEIIVLDEDPFDLEA